jgi:hypothetical protein
MGLRFAVGIVLLLAACQPAAAPPVVTFTPQALPAQDVLPPTGTPNPLLATMEQPTIPPLETFTSRTYGYSFMYPVTSDFEETGDGRRVWIDKQVEITVSGDNPETVQPAGRVIESADSTIIGSLSGRRLAGSVRAASGAPQRFESIVIARGSRFYVITVYELRSDVTLPADRTPGSIPLPATELFNTVLGTLTFASAAP